MVYSPHNIRFLFRVCPDSFWFSVCTNNFWSVLIFSLVFCLTIWSVAVVIPLFLLLHSLPVRIIIIFRLRFHYNRTLQGFTPFFPLISECDRMLCVYNELRGENEDERQHKKNTNSSLKMWIERRGKDQQNATQKRKKIHVSGWKRYSCCCGCCCSCALNHFLLDAKCSVLGAS